MDPVDYGIEDLGSKYSTDDEDCPKKVQAMYFRVQN